MWLLKIHTLMLLFCYLPAVHSQGDEAFTVDYFTVEMCICDVEWFLFENNCYLFAEKDDKQHFSDAQNTCKKSGADLVSISSEDENDFVYYNRLEWKIHGESIFCYVCYKTRGPLLKRHVTTVGIQSPYSRTSYDIS